MLDNGIVQVTLTKPGGIVTCIKYGGIDNLLETHNKETNRGSRFSLLHLLIIMLHVQEMRIPCARL